MPVTARLFTAAVLILTAAIQPTGCRQERSAPGSASPATPASTPAATPSPTPPPSLPEVFPLPSDKDGPIGEGWTGIIEKNDAKARAWIEGSVLGGDRLIVTTHNVHRFRLDFSRLHLNWKTRIVLRLDGFNSELTRKRYPSATFVRTPTGAWKVAED